jgi:hypothetical protein
VQITDSGRDKHRQAQRHWKTVQQALNRRLGESQVAALHQQLDAVMAALSEPDDDLAAGDRRAP